MADPAGNGDLKRSRDDFSGQSDPNLPSPMAALELAKRKAAEIAAKFMSGGDKRIKMDEPSQDYPNPYASNSSSQTSYSSQTVVVEVPNSKVGLVIGKGGETIKQLQSESGARIQVNRDGEQDPKCILRKVEITGTPDQISKAERLLSQVIDEADVMKAHSGVPGVNAEVLTIRIPNNKVGLVIGKGGETIRRLQTQSGCKIQVQGDKEVDPGSNERVINFIGSKPQVEQAHQMLKECIDIENRYHKQQGQGGAPRGPPPSQYGGYRPPYPTPYPTTYPPQQPWAGQYPAGYPPATPYPYPAAPYGTAPAAGYPPQQPVASG